MMRLFLVQKNPSEANKRRLAFDQSFFDPRQNGFTQSFQNNLLGKERLSQASLIQGFFKQHPIPFQRRKQGTGANMPWSQPSNGPLENDSVVVLLARLP